MMDSNTKKMIAVIMAIVVCSACTITGITASSAGHSNPVSEILSASVQDQAEDIAKPALKDGTWEATYESGTILYFVVNSNENSFAIMHDNGIGVPGSFEYEPSLGMYKICSGSADNELRWRVIDNDGEHATVSDENSDLIMLDYISQGDMFA